MTTARKKFWLIQLALALICLTLLLIGLNSCRSTRGYEINTKHFIGYGTYQPPKK